jgi:hypothetical protein
MAEKKTTPITIDGVDHDFESMTEEQKLLVNHCLDLDRKIASAQFNIQQLQVGKDAFVQMLKNALAQKADEAVETVEAVPTVQ